MNPKYKAFTQQYGVIQTLANYFDLFGQSSFFPVRSNQKYKTKLGFFATLLVVLVVLSYGSYRCNVFFKMTSYTSRSSELISQVDHENPDIVNFYDLGFDFAFTMIKDLPREIGYLQLDVLDMTSFVNSSTGFKQYDQDYKKQNLTRCDLNNFNYSDKEEIERQGISKSYYCLENKTELQIGGFYNSKLFKIIEINLYPCTNGSGIVCATEEEIAEHFVVNSLQLRLVNQYFDPSDQINPIKKFIDDTKFFLTLYGQKSFQILSLQKSVAKISGRFPWSADSLQYFGQVKNLISKQGIAGATGTNAIIQLRLCIDLFYTSYEKEYFTFMKLLSELGGLLSIIMIIGRCVITFIVTDNFIYSIISKVYYTDQKHSAQQLQTSNLIASERSANFRKTEIIANLSSKERITLNFYQLLRSSLCCQRCLRSSYSKEERLYQQAKHQFYQDFDIIEVFRSIQEIKAMKENLLTPLQTLLMSHSGQFIVSLEQTNNSQDEPFVEVTCLNPLKRGQAIENLSKKLERLQRQGLSSLDSKLIEQLLHKKIGKHKTKRGRFRNIQIDYSASDDEGIFGVQRKAYEGNNSRSMLKKRKR